MKNIKHLLFVTLISTVTSVQANDISLSTTIEAVTVHPRSAIITRQGQAQLPAGTHRIIVEGLPANLDPARLQFSINNANVRLGSMELNQIHHGDYTEAAERLLRDELQTLQDQRKAVSDSIDTANLQLQLLVSLATGGSNGSIKPSVNGSELANLLNTLSENSTQSRQKIRNATIELRDTDKAIEQKQFELNQVATRRKMQTQLIVNLQMDQAVTAPVAIVYPQSNTYWRWLYEARLDTAKKQLAYNRQVSVVQNTGEDWTDVSLTITTTDNRRQTQTPNLNSVFLDIATPFIPQQSSARELQKNELMNFDTSPMLEEMVVTASRMQRNEATVIASQYLVDYQIPGRVTVLANQQDKVLHVDNKTFDVDLVSRAVPEIDKSVYLEARFTYETDIPMQPGRVQMYRDGAFIGEGQSPALLPDQDIRLPFGSDERISVQVFDESEESKEGGVFSRSSIEQSRTRFEITSYHPQPMDVEILSRIPVSRNAKIDVEIADGATAANESDVDGKSGILMWELEAQPQQTHNIKHYVDISYPKDTELSFEEEY